MREGVQLGRDRMEDLKQWCGQQIWANVIKHGAMMNHNTSEAPQGRQRRGRRGTIRGELIDRKSVV